MRFITASALVFCCWAGSLEAQTEIPRPFRELSLQQCVQLAMQHNLGLQISRYAPRSALYELQGSYGLYDPVLQVEATQSRVTQPGRSFNLATGFPSLGSETTADVLSPGITGVLPTGLRYTIDGTFQHERGTTGDNRIPIDNYNVRAGFSLEQPLLRDFWIDSERYQIRANKSALKVSRFGLEANVMELLNTVQAAYYDLVAARDTVQARLIALELAQKQLEENKRKVEVGTMAVLDEKQAESQVAVSWADLISASNTVSRAENALKSLITDRYEEWHAVDVLPTDKLLAIPESYDLSESWTRALTLRPDFNSMREEVQLRGVKVEFARNQLFPALNLIGGYGRRGVDFLTSTNDPSASFGTAVDQVGRGDNPAYNFGVVLKIPFSFKKERNQFRQAKIEREEFELRLRELHQTILIEVDDAVKFARSAYERVGATREARLYAELALDAEQKRLASGKSTSFVVLQLQRDLTDRRADEIQALADYNKALVELYFREGSLLERNRIEVDIEE